MAKSAKQPKKSATVDKGGRPRKCDRDVVVPKICARLATGEPLTVICRDMGVSVRTVNDWRKVDAEIAAQFDEARDLGFDFIARRSRETARGKGDSTKDVQRDKLIIETDLKLLAKWDPRRYGDKMQHSNDPENPLPAPQFIIQPVRPAEGQGE